MVLLEWIYQFPPWPHALILCPPRDVPLWGLLVELCFTYWTFHFQHIFGLFPRHLCLYWGPFTYCIGFRISFSCLWSPGLHSAVFVCAFCHLCEWLCRHAVWILCLEFHLGHPCWAILLWTGRIWGRHVLVCCCCCCYLWFYIETCTSGARSLV